MKEKTLFETLPNYEEGFFKRADKIEAEAYRQKSHDIKVRIQYGQEAYEDIIFDEQQKAAKAQLRASFKDDDGTATKKANGYWSAVEFIKYSLIDSKPL